MTLYLYATSLCNHSCNHCYLGYEGSWNPDNLFEVTKKYIDRYEVCINGAEILLNLDYLKSLKIAQQRYVFTNGLVFLTNKDTVVESLQANDVSIIRMSNHFEAAESLNAVSPILVEKIASELMADGFRVEYNTTVTTVNYENIKTICERACRQGIKRIKFFPLMPSGKANALESSLYLSKSQIRDFYDSVLEERKKYDISDLEIRLGGDFSIVADKFKCGYGIDYLAVTPDRKVYGCPFSICIGNEIGYLNDNNEIVLTKTISHSGEKCFYKTYLK